MRAAAFLLSLVAAGSAWGQEGGAGANLAARPVSAGDLLAISVYGAPELTRTVRVSAEGTLRLPMLKQRVETKGHWPAALEDSIARALAEEQILVNPVVTVTIAEFASRPISVVGAVRKPLTFQTTGPTSLLDALARAEGLNTGAGAEILITKPVDGTPVTRRVAVRDLLELADPEANMTLEGGEEVRVPEVGRVFVVGNVTKPGGFPVADAQGMTLLKALALAEGLAPFATKEAFIYRPVDGGAKQEILIELRKVMDRKAPDVTLQAGDILYVPDNRRGRMAAGVIDKIVSFAAGTASGALILGVNR